MTTRRKHPPVVCAEPPPGPRTADDVIAETLSIVRGRVFGKRSTEVQLLRQMLRNAGFDVYRVAECVRVPPA